jgi:hypothetical protein
LVSTGATGLGKGGGEQIMGTPHHTALQIATERD